MLTGKKTKIVATIGPATEKEEIMESLIRAGMNVVRLNFTHGNFEEHQKRVDIARKVSKRLNVPIAIFQDLSGPKIRIGDFTTESVNLQKGGKIILTTEPCEGTSERIFVNYEKLSKEIKPQKIIFINDGKVKLEVEKIIGSDIHCNILEGGEIKGRRGVNIPGAYLSISSLTEKDKKDVLFSIKNDLDFVALSFVRKASDILELKDILDKNKANIKIIAKIETQEAIENIDEIIAVSDVIMIARGDLAVELPPEEVPVLQKLIIKKCNLVGKPVITATQMLASMVNSSVPTRAEVNDIANAILDGTDAVMLSEETTLGNHPEAAVKIMTNVALHTEKYIPYEEILQKHNGVSKDITDSISYSAVHTAHALNAKAIIALSLSGFTAKMIARYKPARKVMVVTTNRKTYNQLSLSFNCYPILTEDFQGITETIEKSKKLAASNNFAKTGDTVLLVAGIPFGEAGTTNMILVQKI